MESSDPETFWNQLTKFRRKALLQKLEKKGITQEQLNEQALKEDEIIRNDKDALLGSQPASLIIQKMVLDRARKNGITENLKVLKTEAEDLLTQTDGYYIWVMKKDLRNTQKKASSF